MDRYRIASAQPTCNPTLTMDFTYSPHQEAGGTLHLPSPTPKSHVDSFTASVNNLRRSLSRSPSKPSRLQVCASTPHGSPGSTLSPFALTRTQCQKSPCGHSNHGSFASGSPGGDQTSIPPKKKFSLRRSTAALRSSPRAAASPRSSMRRVLSDSSNQGNVTPSISRRSSGEENKSDENYSPIPKQQTDHKPPVFRFDVNDGPIKFEFARPKQETLIVTSESEPMRSSPLKRGDGQMNFGEAILGAPVKRRSLHAAVGFGADADVFSQPSSPLNLNSPTTHVRESDQNRDRETRDGDLPFEQEQDHLRDRFLERESNFSSFSSPAVKRTSSLRKALHRQTPIFSRSRGFADSSHESFSQGSPALQPRNRMSLDSSYFGAQTGSRSALSPFLTKSSSNSSSPLFPHTHLSQLRNSTHQPHPLSKTLIPSSSASTTSEDSIMAPAPFPESHNDSNEPINAYQQFPDLSKSLPVGSMRPTEVAGQTIDEFSFATPLAPKAIRRSVMSTGLISKTSKPWGYNPYNCDEERFAMPDTPSKLAPTTKRASFPPDAASPFRTSLTNRIAPSYGDNTPANDHSSHPTFNVSTAIGYHYGNELERRSTFGSNDSDEHINQQEFQSSSADEMPPTPTKPAGSGRFKQNSLRSNIFGRRPSLAPDTFSAPDNDFEDVQSPRLIRKGKQFNNISHSIDFANAVQREDTCPPSPAHRPRPRSVPLAVLHRRAQQAAAASNIAGPSDSPALQPVAEVDEPCKSNFSWPAVHQRVATTSLSVQLVPTSFTQPQLSTVQSCQPEFLTIVSPQPLRGFQAKSRRAVTPINQIASGRASPHTPDGSFAAPDPSSLSISGIKTKVHTNDPATPTAQRDHGFRFGASHFDVDDEIRKKFSTAVMIGHGEFSVVYRVEGPRGDAYGSDASLLGPADPKVWVIKKCMKPYIGVRDRNRKANEAIILDQLRNREHIVEFVSSFETPENQLSRHLYIQTEFCSQGNLKEFVMEAGHNCRLDDFRVWKILFELCLVSVILQ